MRQPSPRAWAGPRRSPLRRILIVAGAAWLAWGATSASRAQGGPVTFSVTGDIPYSSSDADRLRAFVADHNALSPAGFFVHVGDIKSQGSCPEADYVLASDILRELAVPTFVLPGDNEWNDCPDPDAAWVLWETHLADFEQQYCGTPEVEAQAVRLENFAFVRERVLFIGLNLVGGAVHDAAEWSLRLGQDADWVEQQLAERGGQVRAAVVFGHAGRNGSRNAFFDRFDVAALAFGRPILFIHGDGHSWQYDSAWGAANVWRIEIEQGAPPLEVTVTLDPESPFAFERDPWPPGMPDLNQPPCVDAGPDQIVPLGEDARLDGFVTDDGIPTQGALALAWSQVSGPGPAVFADPGSETTSVGFPLGGTYVLELAADDGELAAVDEMAIVVDTGQPSLWIRDVTLVEGSGASTAVFRVDLLSASGAPVGVDYETLDGTALDGSDYEATSGSLVFSGATTFREIAVPVIGDADLEEFESFQVLLSNASGALVADGDAVGLILDDDIPRPPVVVSFAPASGPPGTVVTLSGQFSNVVAASVGGVPASFTPLSETRLELVVPPDARSGPIRVANVAGASESAAPFAVEFELTVSVRGSGGVTLSPPGGSYVQGTAVTLTPQPSSGWEFLVWSGDLGTADAPAVLRVLAPTSVTASFVEAGSVVRNTWSAAVASSSNDAEEGIASGSVSLSSADLELGEDLGSAQAVGVRFADVAIPQGTRVLSASVQFEVDEVSTGPAELLVRGVASDSAAPFVSASGDVTGRPTTEASVTWSPPAWTATGAAGAAQRTPDLSAIVQEIVDRPGWTPGNALALVVTGSGRRTAESYDGAPSAAARLEVTEVIDVRAPETPAHLRASETTGTSLALAWDPAYDNLGVTGYRVYRPGGPVDVAGTSHTETGLAPDTEHVFQVSALDAAGNESPPSPPLRLRTLARDRQPPTTPADLNSPAQSETTIELAWSAATDAVGVDRYRVYRLRGPIDVAATSWVETGLEPDRPYAFQVSALDAAGNESLPSEMLVVRTLAPDRERPAPPANLRSPLQTETRIDLNWDAATDDVGVSGYRLYSPGGFVHVPGTSHSADGLTPDSAYTFQVSAFDAAGNESPPTAALTVRTRAPARDRQAPTTPANLRSPAQTETTIDLAWDAAVDDVGVSGYRLYGPNGPVDVGGTHFVESGLVPGREYACQVSALDAAGNESPPSAMLVVRTRAPDRQAPTTPQNLRAPAWTETAIDLAWEAAADDVAVAGYRLYRPWGPIDVAGTAHTESGLGPDTPYTFQVSAFDAAGNESPPSEVLSLRTRPRDLGPPTTPQALRSPARTETTITLAWDAATDDVAVSSYRLYGPGGPVETAGTLHTVQGLAPDRIYSFQVSALDAAGNESPPGPVLAVRTLARDRLPPTTPQSLRSPARTETTIDLAWDPAIDDVGVAGYRLYTAGGAVDVPGTSYGVSGLERDTDYAFQVSALDAAGNESPPSPVHVVRTRAPDRSPPTPPGNLRSPSRTKTTIELAWDPASDDVAVTGYRLYRASGFVDLPGTSHTETGLSPGRLYGFQVAALDAAGNESMPSPMLAVRTVVPDLPPSTPQSLRSPAQTQTTIDLAWDASSDDVGISGYRVYGPGGPVDVAGTSTTRTGLSPDTEYAFQVSALDTAGQESAPSALLTVRTAAPDVEPPSTPQNLRSPAQTETTVDLAWDASSDDVGVSGYRVHGPTGSVDVPGTSYTWTGLDPLSSYDFQVSAFDAAGNESAPGAPLTVSTRGLVPASWNGAVSGSADDAEENLGTGSVNLASSDLELAFSGAVAQAVGLRFAGAAIPPGATIVSASVQFTVDEVSSGPAALTFRGEAAADAPPFAATSGNVSGRPTTSASTAWSPPDWTAIGAAGAAQRTPDLAAIVQEIVDGPGWASGNALVLIVTGSGTRTAESYNGVAAAAPRLDVAYLIAPDTQPPSVPTNLRSPLQTRTSIALAWDAATDDRAVSGYRVHGPGPAVDVAGTSHTWTGLDPITSYQFQVSAFDAAGNESAASPPLDVSTTDTETLLLRVANGIDDVEESLATGAVNRTSSDLDLGLAATTDQAVGLRFPGVAIPQGATLVSATVQFTTDEVSSGAVALSIRGEAADDAAPFATTAGDVSGRPATSAATSWSPPDWTSIGSAGAAERTPDLSAVVQEIVDRPGWRPGNALVLVLTGSGTRTAESWEGAAAAAPELRVEFRGP